MQPAPEPPPSDLVDAIVASFDRPNEWSPEFCRHIVSDVHLAGVGRPESVRITIPRHSHPCPVQYFGNTSFCDTTFWIIDGPVLEWQQRIFDARERAKAAVEKEDAAAVTARAVSILNGGASA